MAKRPISYTSRDFESIKASLVDHAKRYYPDSYKDFNEASFGSLMIDAVSYVGDVLSFYLDYQANESFLDSAIETKNIARVGRQLGFREDGSPSSTGVVAFYAVIPINASGEGPDIDQAPILRKDSTVGSTDGNSFILIENVDFADANNEVVVARVDNTTGQPTHYAIKSYGKVISGELRQETFTIGEYQRFLRVAIAGSNISTIISVEDSDGREYLEVPFLSQDVIYAQVPNYSTDSSERAGARFTLKAIAAPRRFTVDFVEGLSYLQFGYGSSTNLTEDVIADPAEVVLNTHGRSHITDDSFDPSKLLKTDKFGIVPANTTLTVTYRANTTENVNAAVGTVDTPIDIDVVFQDRSTLTEEDDIINSIECFNEEAILGDVTTASAEEMRIKAYDNFAAQNRAVTKQDYAALCYRMPPEFGSVKRVNILRDEDSFKRNLNLYVLSENVDGNFVSPTQTIKENLRTWISRFKMLNDTVDIFNGEFVNLKLSYEVVSGFDVNKYDLLTRCNEALEKKFNAKYNMGESFYLSDVYITLNAISGVVDTTNVIVQTKSIAGYSQYPFNVNEHLSNDGRVLRAPDKVAFEIKDFDADITGVIK
jgi:hypothetical protein|tara:strand:+ start:20 stop:1810 length:1791 start_codon:yes stop_codon:yes gene_type:complete